MDVYGKGVLTIIAILLAVIAVGVWAPYVNTDSAKRGPTLGDMLQLRDIQNPEMKKSAHMEMMRRVPLVKVYGKVYGTVDIQGSVDVEQ